MLATTEFHLIQPRKLAFFIRDRLDFRLVITAINRYPFWVFSDFQARKLVKVSF